MNQDLLKKELERDERRCSRIYTDTVGKVSGGVGRNLSDNGFRENEVDLMLQNDIDDTLLELDRSLPWWKQMSDARQRVFANMAFNMGLNRFLGFAHMIEAAKVGRWDMAAAEMMDSKWAKQVGDRAKRLEKMMREG